MAQSQDIGHEDGRLSDLGYKQELSRVLSKFDSFSVAFTYLSPMVGIYSLFVLGAGTAGPRYIWLMLVPVIGMYFVAMIFAELGSHYPVSGALYQYSKFSVGPRYGWWVGWFYSVALLVTMAAVDTGVVPYLSTLLNNWFNLSLDPANHSTILLITIIMLAVQSFLNITGAKVMGRVASFGSYVEIFGTIGIALILAAAGFHHGFGFLFSSQGAETMKTNSLGVDFGGNWWTGAAFVAVLAHVFIFYGFESAGDVAEETKDASRQVPRAMRQALVVGAVTSFILVAALLLATPSDAKGYAEATSFAGGVPYILQQSIGSPFLRDILLLAVCFAFFSCGSSIQGASARMLYAYARDGQTPASGFISRVSTKHRTPVNALLVGATIPVAFTLLVNVTPTSDIHIGFFTYPANVSALTALVSFGVSGIYIAFGLTVLGALIARLRGWKPSGHYTLGRKGMLVNVIALVYLVVMFVNLALPSGLSSPRGALFNLDWVTLVVVALLALAGLVVRLLAPGSRLAK
ncbi:MAG: APC family permease [Candidatus Nanopelagicales bacterium]